MTTVPPTATLVCTVDDLVPDLGIAALVDNQQVAIFRLSGKIIHVVQNLDPFSGVDLISRGITGSRGDSPTVASPMYKQVFDLTTGKCIDTVGMSPKIGISPHLEVFDVWVVHGEVYIARSVKPKVAA